MALPRDPDLEPVPAAMAHLASQAPAQPSARPRPVIAPAEPERWSAVIDLAFPLLVDGERVERLTLRAITAREIADIILEDDRETSINAGARAMVCGVHPDVLEALAAVDGEKVAAACRPFLPQSLVAAEDEAAEAVAEAAFRAGD